jgi:hypothetical protein
MKPLFQLVEQYRQLQAIDPEEVDSQTLSDTLEALGGEIQEKAKNVAYYARNIESFADQVDEAAAQMKERAKRLREKASGIRGYILNQMQGAGITKIQAPEFTLAIRKNPPAVQIKSDASIPSDYMVKPEPPAPYPDKRKLADALKAGTVIDGVSLEQGVRLDIR